MAARAGDRQAEERLGGRVDAIVDDVVLVVHEAVANGEEPHGGQRAANMKVAEAYVSAFRDLAKAGNTLIIPSNLSDAASFVSSAMTVLDRAKVGTDLQKRS